MDRYTCFSPAQKKHLRFLAHRMLIWFSSVSRLIWCHSAAGQECTQQFLSERDPQYLFEKAPKMRALVIGNRNYENLAPIKSSEADGEIMHQRLSELGFDVVYSRDVETVRQFEDVVLPTFRSKIEEGDLVVFYFSGHGFSYGPHEFVVPTEMPRLIPETNITDFAISVDAFKDLVARRKPGLIMFFIDACRSIGDFIVQDEQGRNVISKGPPHNPQNQHDSTNSFVFYATQAGEIAEAFSVSGRLSPFTEAIANHIGTEGKPFSAVFRDIADEVFDGTNGRQNPGNHDWSKTDPYLKPNARNLDEEFEAWLSSLCTRDSKQVARFSRRHSVSRHAAASRKWLADNMTTRYASASPAAIDRAWRTTNVNRLSVLRLAAPLAFDRSVEEIQEQKIKTLSNPEIGLVASGMAPQPEDAFAFGEAALIAHKNVVATRDLSGRPSPYPDGHAGKRILIPSGTRLEIKNVTVGTHEKLYVTATTAEDFSPFLITLSAVAAPRPLELGQSLKQIVIPPRSTSTSDLVDPVPINQALSDLHAEGWRITWVSLATAAADTESEQDERAMRLANAEYILKHAGIRGVRITSVSGRDDFSGDGVRVRFFGVKQY